MNPKKSIPSSSSSNYSVNTSANFADQNPAPTLLLESNPTSQPKDLAQSGKKRQRTEVGSSERNNQYQLSRQLKTRASSRASASSTVNPVESSCNEFANSLQPAATHCASDVHTQPQSEEVDTTSASNQASNGANIDPDLALLDSFEFLSDLVLPELDKINSDHLI